MEAEFLFKENGDHADAASGHQNNSLNREWNLNEWRWDTHLFLATPSNTMPSSDCGGREYIRSQGEIDFGVVDQRWRISPGEGSAECSNAAATDGENRSIVVQRAGSSEEERYRKGASSNSAPSCQVDGCQADLSGARDYHKRHKVCEPHTRSTVVRIKCVEHRFCQQCSRFHLLQEFDEGKKSCRSRLAKHNVRRRKVQTQAAVDGHQSLRSTLVLLLKQLSALESGSLSERVNHPNHLVKLLENFASIVGTQTYQDLLKNANSISTASNAGNYVGNGFTVHEQNRQPIHVGNESSPEGRPVKRRVQDFDLNDAYIEDVESRTDKIVFKLFGKEPKDFPVNLRSQILNWLSQYPSEMESYIRPGCVILTVYLRLPNWMWDELDDDPAPWIEKLVSMPNCGFWRTGWVYARVQNWLTLCCNGRLVLASPWQPVIGDKHQILCVTPVAVACSSTAKFLVKGFNIVRPTTKLLCIFGEKYLIQEETQMLHEDTAMQQGPQCLTFSCSFPNTSGRGLIEIEDCDQSNLSIPFVVTEEDVCSEIRMLEHELNLNSASETLEDVDDRMASHDQALHFLQEIGWLLQRSHMRAMSDQAQYSREGFPVGRFRWLLSFAVDHEWCAVVKKLLDIMFEGNIDLDDPSPVEFARGLNLLFAAVNKRSKPLVECLLRYTTANYDPVDNPAANQAQFLFTPEMTGSSNITPLHTAATISDAAGVLDALTDDPQQMGINVWKNARDDTGFTPEDYARKRGFISYIQMVEVKIDRRIPKAHLSVAIPSRPCTTNIVGQHTGQLNSADKMTFDLEKCSIKKPLSCNKCVQRVTYSPQMSRILSNRPAVLSLVAVAAVCVCVGLLLRSPPFVRCMRPFRWEHIKWGPK